MTDTGRIFWLGLTLGVALLLYILSPVLTPFLVSAALAYLGDPLVDRLEGRGYRRGLAVALVFTAMLLAGLLALIVGLPALGSQLEALLGTLPAVLDWLQKEALPNLLPLLGGEEVTLDRAGLRALVAGHWQQVGGALGEVLRRLTASWQLLLTVFAYVTLVPVVTFYLLRDWDLLVRQVRELLPRRIEPRVVALACECDQVLAEFLRGQLLVMLALAAIYSVGLLLCGLELALIVGVIAGLVSFVPYLGFIVGVTLAGMAAVAQFHDLIHLFWVLVVFAVGQALESLWLSPWLVGDRIGLHPVAVIFAVLAGGQLFGFLGVLLALPAAAVVVVLLRHTHDAYRASALYGP
jgi:predicted PurR-regulated permease PerM